MGLLSFLSRKSGHGAKATNTLKPPVSYTSFTAEPSAQGCSVTNNDPDPPEPFTRERPEFTRSQVSLDAGSEFEPPASVFQAPRRREQSVERRPSTAPSDRPPSTVFADVSPRVKGNGQRKPPPLSFRMARPGTAIPNSRPVSRGSISSIASVFRRGPGHSRANSIRSDGGKAFKDILDAQSEIKPADFKERVKATGVRDYGEDVAERNLALSGFSSEPNHIPSIYPQPLRLQLPHRAPEPFPRVDSKLGTHQEGVWKRPVRSSSQQPLSRFMAPSGPPRTNSPLSNRREFGRRRSINSYISPDKEGLGGFSPFDQNTPSNFGHNTPRTPAPNMADFDFGFPTLEVSSPSIPYAIDTAPAPTIRTARVPRDSVEVMKQRVEAPAPEDAVDDSPSRLSHLHSATRARRSSTMTSTASSTRKHLSLYTLRSSMSSSVASRDTLLLATALSYPRRAPLQPQVQETAERPSIDFDPALFENDDASTLGGLVSPSLLKTYPNIPKPREEDVALPRPRSHSFLDPAPEIIPSSAGIALPDDILEYPPPIRTRSMRGWSASSGTPSASESTVTASFTTASSRAFHRAPSLHTAGTSVDLDACPVSPALKRTSPVPVYTDSDSDSDVPNDESNNKPDHSDAEAGTSIYVPPLALEKDTFNIDDYLSSDVDSITTPSRRPTGEGEEELLFNDAGYGFTGMQLPGLMDPFPSPVPSAPGSPAKALRRGRSSPVLSKGAAVALDVYDNLDIAKIDIQTSPKKTTRARERKGKPRLVPDTVSDEDSKSEWEGEHAVVRRREERCPAPRWNRNTDDDDDGYEADYVEDEDETLARRRRATRKPNLRPSVPCRAESEEEQLQEQAEQKEERREQSPPPQSETAEDRRGAKLNVAAAVKLRKEVKRARLLAGETAAAGLRRTRTRMSLPILRVEGAV